MTLRSICIGLLTLSMVLTSGAMALARMAPDGRNMVICTGMGVATIVVDAGGNELAPAPICPDCLAQQVAALIAPGLWTRPLTLGRQSYQGVTQATNHAAEQVPAAARGPPKDM